MPRGPRLDAPGILQHVIARGIERGKIFINNDDYNSFIDRLGKVTTETGTSILAWCLLPNHFHLLLKTNNGSLPLFMRRLLTGHAVTFNCRHKRSGHLFQNRYKSIVCQEDAYLLQLIRYIHLNPIRAGLVEDMAHLDDYPYSSHQILIGKRRLSWQKDKDTLIYFGKTTNKARKSYRNFLTQETTTDLEGGGLLRSIGGLESLTKEKIAFDERILGDSAFVEELLQIESIKNKIKPKAEITPHQLINQVVEYFKIAPEDLKGSRKTSSATAARAAISYLAVECLGLKGAGVARLLKVDRACICRLIPRGREVLAKHNELEGIINNATY